MARNSLNLVFISFIAGMSLLSGCAKYSSNSQTRAYKESPAPEFETESETEKVVTIPEVIIKVKAKSKNEKPANPPTQVTADTNKYSNTESVNPIEPSTLNPIPEASTEPTKKPKETKTITPTPAKSIAETTTHKTSVPDKNSSPSTANLSSLKFIRTAYDVVVNEGKKLGTACNRYVMRVLQLMGFNSRDGFVANGFDIYAKKNFKNYKAHTFSNTKELDLHLKSYPERTAFILQWKRAGRHGHIAILERYNNKYFIYQSSLNSYTPKVGATTVNSLLNSSSRKNVIVYSDFLN